MTAEPKRVLLVDSDVSRSKSLAGVLTELNYDVVAAPTAEKAVEALSASDINVVLACLDGKAGGFDVLKAVRSKRGGKTLPVVLMSGANDAEGIFDAYRKKGEGVSGYVRLPAEEVDLVDWVEKLIGLPPPVNGSGVVDGDLRREIEVLQEQVHFYEKQLEHVSMSGVREEQQMDQVLKEMQEDLDKAKAERDRLRDEVKLLSTSAKRLEKERESALAAADEIKEEHDRVRASLTDELEAVRTALNENEEKHRRAQSALREYYKPKIAKIPKLKKSVVDLEKSVEELAKELKEAREGLDSAKGDLESALDDLKEEKARNKDLRSKLDQLKKVLE